LQKNLFIFSQTIYYFGKTKPFFCWCRCGQVQTGVFHDGAAPNGLFGLGLDDISVPSVLAKEGIAANSFSMCFGKDGAGRISFGDKGSVDQRETPLNIRQPQ